MYSRYAGFEVMLRLNMLLNINKNYNIQKGVKCQ